VATLRLYVEPSCSCNRFTILPEVRAMHLPCGVFLYARWLFRAADFSERRLGEVRSQTLGPDPKRPASRNTPGHRDVLVGLAARWVRQLR
jgi:hypothetical protein